MSYSPRLKDKYTNEIVPSLKEKFKYKNDLMIPKIEKVVLETLSNTALWGQNLAQISPLKDSLTQALNTIISQDKISDAHRIFQNLQS